MTVSPATQESAFPKSPLLALLAGGLLLAAGGCNGSSSAEGGANAPGTIVTGPGGTAVIVDPNNMGLATEVRIGSAFWGRLVDVFGLDSAGERTLMQHDFLIGPSLESSLGTYILETSPVTGGQSLTIERDVTDLSVGGGRSQFFGLLRAAEANLAPLSDQPGGGAGIFTMVPRNATVVVIFDDLLDPNLITRGTVLVRTGSPSTTVYDARIFADPNHGDLIEINGSPRFYPTRILIDPTVSEAESIADGQGLAINTAGFPASLDANLSNVSIQIPTVEDFTIGQTSILKNRSGHEISTTLNGTVDLTSPLMPVLRNFRSGGRQAVTGDPFNGFLPDDIPPQVVGTQGGSITGDPFQNPGDDEDEFTIPTFQFSSPACAQTPVVGDVICQTNIFAEVIEDALPPDVGGLVANIRVRLLAFPDAFASPADWIATAQASPATFLSAYDPVADSGTQECFVRVTPSPTTAPATGIATDTRFSVQFGEPMDRASFSAFDSLVLSSTTGIANQDLIVGRIEATLDLQRFTFAPAILLAHAAGQSEPYTLHLDPGTVPPTDLAGNALEVPLPPATFTVEPGQNAQRNGGHVSRFSAIDEEAPIGNVANGDPPLPEYSGQHFYDTARGIIRPRAVTRFEAVADRTQPVFALAVPSNQGSPTPMSSSGSKLQAFWRPVDLNMSYDDPTRYNLDVEGLNWAPYQELVSTDRFERFEIGLAHGRFSPDEYVCPGPPAFALFQNSGVVSRFQDNLLSLTEDPLTVVHDRFRGFSIAPGQIFASATGTRLVPFPLNQDIPADQYRYYTWRDTGIQTRGGVTGSGPTVGGTYIPLEVPPYTYHVTVSNPFAGCLPTDTELETDILWEENLMQSVALPLLMEFRCFPDNGAASSNLTDTTVTQNAAFRPFFRAHSTGGVGTTGPVEIDPDLESVATGGFNPTNNATTPGNDRVTHVGSIDLVVRISRSYSIWRLANERGSPTTSFLSPRYGVPILEPDNADQPNGTSIQVAMRGATAITNFLTNAAEGRDALSLDAYGDVYGNSSSGQINHSDPLPNQRIAAFNNDSSWHDPDPDAANPTGLDGAQYYQLRITFQSNPISGLVPTLSAIGITWKE